MASQSFSKTITLSSNVLLVHPDFSDPGGVAGYFKHFEHKFKMPLSHFFVGSRPIEKGLLQKSRRILLDYYNFIMLLKNDSVRLVHLNPSLDPKSMFRDGIFVLLANASGKKTIVFFHGWHKSFETAIERYYLSIVKCIFKKVNIFIVLSNDFRQKLQEWGFNQPIELEVTVIDDDFVDGFNVCRAITKRHLYKNLRILFLSRIIKEKGIYETVEAFSLLQPKYPMLELVVAGDGEELENIMRFVANRNIQNIRFIGYVSGSKKREILENAYLYCLPSYSEGMPGSIVEAMAFGLPVITRPVGGIKDFFENEIHGFYSNSKNPSVFAELIERLIMDKVLHKKISLNNYRYAQSNFLASRAASRLENIYESMLANP